jgi:aspartyl-tRNA(Asn)/glutamyl-tRNA(Gln) amidotransferase subunit A
LLVAEYRFATIGELQSGLRDRRISAVELASAVLDGLESVGSQYNAVAVTMRERALSEAMMADRRMAGAARGEALPPLLGIPYGAKDLLAARGAPTTWGAPPYRDQWLDFDATAVALLRDGGAVLTAKLAMLEFAGGGDPRYADCSLQGPGLNPWNRERWTGGSSSGSAAALAAGLVPFALGSETSGSIGTPSAYCGVTGLRPTYGLVSRHGAMALSWTLDKIGPMARTAADCGTVLQAIGVPDPLDRTSSGRTYASLDGSASAPQLRDIRVGFAEEDVSDHASPAARRALEAGVDEVRALFPRFSRAVLPAELPYGPTVLTVYGAEMATIFADLIEGPRFDEVIDAKQKAGMRASLKIQARDYLQAMRVRVDIENAFAALFDKVDVLLSVGSAATAPRTDQALDYRPPAGGHLAAGTSDEAKRPGNMALIAAANLAGLPAIFFPCGFGDDGMPVGLQLVGPPFSEGLLVGLASAYQQNTEHHAMRPMAMASKS